MVLKETILTVCTFGGGGCLKRTNFLTLCTFGGCGGLKELIFRFVLLEGVVVLKELIFYSWCFGRVWWS